MLAACKNVNSTETKNITDDIGSQQATVPVESTTPA